MKELHDSPKQDTFLPETLKRKEGLCRRKKVVKAKVENLVNTRNDVIRLEEEVPETGISSFDDRFDFLILKDGIETEYKGITRAQLPWKPYQVKYSIRVK